MADTAAIRAGRILHTVALAVLRAMADRAAEFPATEDPVAHLVMVVAAPLVTVAAGTTQRRAVVVEVDTTLAVAADILPAEEDTPVAEEAILAVAAAIRVAEDAEVIAKRPR